MMRTQVLCVYVLSLLVCQTYAVGKFTLFSSLTKKWPYLSTKALTKEAKISKWRIPLVLETTQTETGLLFILTAPMTTLITLRTKPLIVELPMHLLHPMLLSQVSFLFCHVHKVGRDTLGFYLVKYLTTSYVELATSPVFQVSRT